MERRVKAIRQMWPWMSKKEHNVKLNQLKRDYRYEMIQQLKTLDEDKKSLGEVISNLYKISLVHSYAEDRYRLVLDFDPRMVMALERGNDARMIDYIVETMSTGIRRELKSMNIQRPETLGLGRNVVDQHPRPEAWDDKE